MLGTILTIVGTSLLTCFLLVVYVSKTMKGFLDVEIPNILSSAGESISKELEEVFTNPQVSKAMTILGKQSGQVRSDKALRTKVSENLMGQYPALKMVLDQLDISPVEGLQLLNDPMIGPTIRGLIGQVAGGAGGLLKGQPNNSGGSGSDKVGYK